jgi:hypothetical protein
MTGLSSIPQLPEASRVAALLSDTLGEKIDATGGGTGAPAPGEVTATYVDDKGEIRGACLLSLALAACLGAALVRVPPGAALEAASQKMLSETLVDTLHEVLNIAAQLFRTPASHRVFLGTVYLPGEQVPDAVAAKLKRPAAILNLEVKLPRYTTGKMSLVTLA